MENIRSLIQNLNSKELEVVKNYIHGFSSRAGDEEKKTWKLMQMILNDKKQRPVAEYAKNIYNSERDFKLDKLKSRLKNKIFDSLVLDINIERRDAFDQNENASLRISKKLVTVKYLIYSYQEPSYIFRLLNEIKELSLKYENYNALLETLHLRKKMIIDHESDSFADLNSRIEYYAGCMNHLMAIEDLYFLKVYGNLNYAGCNISRIESIDRELQKIEEKFIEFPSPLANYFKLVIMYARSKQSHNFKLAEEFAKELIRIIPLHPSVDRKISLGAAYHCLAESVAAQGRYAESMDCCNNAQLLFSPRSLNYLASKEFEFYVSLSSGEITNAKNCLYLLLKSVQPDHAFRKSKFEYFEAAMYFMEKNYMQTYKMLRRHLEISKDKNGWDLAVRILTIQTCIELGYDSEASKYIELLRKQIKRKTSDQGIRTRTEIILKIFMSLDKRSFNFSAAYPYVMELLEKLKSKDVHLVRIFNGPELICLNSWYMNKL